MHVCLQVLCLSASMAVCWGAALTGSNKNTLGAPVPNEKVLGLFLTNKYGDMVTVKGADGLMREVFAGPHLQEKLGTEALPVVYNGNYTAYETEDIDTTEAPSSGNTRLAHCSDVQLQNYTDISERSVCPWNVVIHEDPDRQPVSILTAQCLCDKCFKDRAATCQKMFYTIPVLRLSGSEYHSSEEKIVIACVCAF